MDAAVSAHMVFGGYLIVRPFVRPPAMNAEILPARIVTASGCLTDLLPDIWTLSWGDVPAEVRGGCMARLAIATAFEDLARHADALFAAKRIVWPGYIQDAGAVDELLAFVGKGAEIIVLGLGLHETLIDSFLRDVGDVRNAASTLVGALSERHSMPADGRVLGFEPLGFESVGGGAHSWHCNGLATYLFERHGVRPNRHGLLDDYQLADRWCDEITREQLGEPVLWLPWMIVDYTPHVAR